MEMPKDDIQRATETLKDEVSKLNEAMVTVPIGIGDWGAASSIWVHGCITYADVLNRQLTSAHLQEAGEGEASTHR